MFNPLTGSRYAAPADPAKLEQAFYAPFAGILQGDVQGKPRYSV